MAIELTLNDVRSYAEQAVAGRPAGYRYGDDFTGIDGDMPDYTPRYTTRTQDGVIVPACIVGHVLNLAGFDLSWFWTSTLNHDYNETNLEGLIDILEHRGEICLNGSGTLDYLHNIQWVQDSGKTWREAVDYANTQKPYGQHIAEKTQKIAATV